MPMAEWAAAEWAGWICRRTDAQRVQTARCCRAHAFALADGDDLGAAIDVGGSALLFVGHPRNSAQMRVAVDQPRGQVQALPVDRHDFRHLPPVTRCAALRNGANATIADVHLCIAQGAGALGGHNRDVIDQKVLGTVTQDLDAPAAEPLKPAHSLASRKPSSHRLPAACRRPVEAAY
jgi:hypothetical protein